MRPTFLSLTLALAAATLAADTASADLPIAPTTPPAAIVNIESDDQLADVTSPGGRVVFARTAGLSEGQPDSWWLRLDVRIANTSATARYVTGFTVDTDVTTPEEVALDEPVRISAHSYRTIIVPGGFGASGAMPDTLGVRAKLQGYAQPIQRIVPLVEYKSPTRSRGYLFPARSNDLPTGVFWSAGVHAHTLTQRYAYDFGNRRWDAVADRWTGHTAAAAQREAAGGAPAGTFNTDSLIWQRPVYALAAATVVRCWRSAPDNTPGESVPGGGNNVILHLGNGTFVAYYHLRQHSVPRKVCPRDGSRGIRKHGPKIRVAAGQFLGTVGNSGHSSGPHLHLQLSDSAGPDDPAQRGLPLRFKGIRIHGSAGYNPEVDASSWNVLSTRKSAVVVNALIKPRCVGPTCSFTTG